MADCATCTKPVADTGYHCHQCTAAHATQLLNLARIVDELHTTVARQDRIDRPAGPRRPDDDEPVFSTLLTDRPGMNLGVRRPAADSAFATRALPVDLDAAGHRDAITTTLTYWSNHIIHIRGVYPQIPTGPTIGPPCPRGWCRHDTCHLIRTPPTADPLAEMAKFVAAHLGWLRVRPESVQAWIELTAVCRRVERVVDRPVAQWYAGPCWEPLPDGGECEQELYFPAGQEWIRCRGCQMRHSAAARREWLMGQARDLNATAREMSRLVAAYSDEGSKDLPALLRKWVERHRIFVKGQRDGRNLFRVGDVLDLLATGHRAHGAAA